MERPSPITSGMIKQRSYGLSPGQWSASAGSSPLSVTALGHLHDEYALPSEVKRILQQFLVEPMLELKNRPSHRFRSDLVEVGYRLAGGGEQSLSDKANLALCANSIEYLHLGSLIVDDVQDGSQVRRKGEALHRILGAPHAIGIGNWLYFYALRLLGGLELSGAEHTLLYATYTKTVELAHYGQIMDLCVKVDQVPLEDIEALCHECCRFKTGSIVMLALLLGALVGRADSERLRLVEAFGYELGAYLQRLNDLGNIGDDFDPEKKWEDLLARKPSFIWAFILHEYGPDAFKRVLAAVDKLPSSDELENWFHGHGFLERAKHWVDKSFAKAWQDFSSSAKVDAADLEALQRLKERIRKAYV